MNELQYLQLPVEREGFGRYRYGRIVFRFLSLFGLRHGKPHIKLILHLG